MLDDKQGYPLSPITVSGDGIFSNRFSIPSAVLPLVARVTFVDVSIAPVKSVRKLVRDAIENTELVLEEPGELILRGEIPKSAGRRLGGGHRRRLSSGLGQQLARVHDPGGIEALLERPQGLEARSRPPRRAM